MKHFLTSFTLIAMAAGSARATNLFSDDFTYADGNLADVTGGNWTRAIAETGKFKIASNTLSINDDPTGIDNIYRTLPSSVSSGTVYASFRLTMSAVDFPTSTAVSATAGTYISEFAQATSGTTNFTAKIFANAVASGGGGAFKMGIARGGGTGATVTYLSGNLSYSTEYLIVQSFDYSTNTARFWVNPASEASPSTADISGTTFASPINVFGFHTQSSAGGDMVIDDLNVATTFGEVVRIVGDANRDGLVNSIDFGFLASNYGTLSGATWAMGDFDADGKVTSSDFNLLAGNFGPSAGPSLGAVVPEPGFAGVLLVGMLLKRSRKQG